MGIAWECPWQRIRRAQDVPAPLRVTIPPLSGRRRSPGPRLEGLEGRTLLPRTRTPAENGAGSTEPAPQSGENGTGSSELRTSSVHAVGYKRPPFAGRSAGGVAQNLGGYAAGPSLAGRRAETADKHGMPQSVRAGAATLGGDHPLKLTITKVDYHARDNHGTEPPGASIPQTR